MAAYEERGLGESVEAVKSDFCKKVPVLCKKHVTTGNEWRGDKERGRGMQCVYILNRIGNSVEFMDRFYRLIIMVIIGDYADMSIDLTCIGNVTPLQSYQLTE